MKNLTMTADSGVTKTNAMPITVMANMGETQW